TQRDGTFTLADLPEGSYRLSVRHPLLDSIGAAAEPVEVSVRPGDVATARVRLPSRGDVLFARCRGRTSEAAAVLAGRVLDGAGAPVPDAAVQISWSSFAVSGVDASGAVTGPVGVRESRQGVDLTTDVGGVFTACEVPRSQRIDVEARIGGE